MIIVPKYLIDTNVLIEAILGIAPSSTFVERAINEGSIALSAIVVAEFLSKASKEEQEKLDLLTAHFGVFPIDQTIAQIAAEYRKEFSQKSKKVYLLDCLVAGTAKLHGLTVITNNTTDYPMKDIIVIAPTQ